MVVPMDARLIDRPAGATSDILISLPPEQPIAMPVQPLSSPRTLPAWERDGRWRLGVIVFLSSLVTTYAGSEMYGTLAAAGMTLMEWTALALFCLNFSWLTAACGTAVAGCLVLLGAKRAPEAAAPAPALEAVKPSRTAIIFPIYNETAARVMGGAEAVFDALGPQGARKFEVFFLSDTTDPDLALAEEAVYLDVAKRRPGAPFFYRRRTINLHRKSGNVTDFVERWGGRYDYMVVFDADSLMSPAAVCELVRRMDERPTTALIQTLPIIVNARTLFARAQQFALRAYGVLFGAGLAWWSGGAGNFWGHNAIIRVSAFAAHARLPDLPGKAPMGGPIMSHDFVEAALLRRAGWRVEIAADIEGSYEECPPTMVDIAVRDRRWAQGNMQHLSVIGARGFDWISRAHIAAGVMGYLSAVLWLSLIVAGIGLALQARLSPPDYFPEGSLLPAWPVQDAARGWRLFALTAVVVLSPKWLALIVWSVRKLPGWGMHPRFILYVIAETALTAVTAPIQMINQTSAVIATLRGRDAGWRPQVRDRNGFEWGDLMRHYQPHMIVGVVLLVVTLAISPMLALWTAPVTISLLFAPMLSAGVAQRMKPGTRLARLLATPEDERTPDVVTAAAVASAKLEHVRHLSFEDLVKSDAAAQEHAGLVDSHWALHAGDVHAPTAYVLARLESAGKDKAALLSRFTREERMAVINRPDLLARLSRALRGVPA